MDDKSLETFDAIIRNAVQRSLDFKFKITTSNKIFINESVYCLLDADLEKIRKILTREENKEDKVKSCGDGRSYYFPFGE